MKLSNLIKIQDSLIPIYKGKHGNQLVNARELHEFLKVHQDFSDWIKKQLEVIESTENVDFARFPFKREQVSGVKTSIEYILTLDTAKEVCMIAGVAPRTNEETKKLSKQARQYFIEVEKAWNSPEMVTKRAMDYLNWRVEVLKIENDKKLRQLEQQEPKVLFANSVQASTTSILVGELAKILKQNGIEIGQNRLFAWMRDNGYLISRKGTDYNMPTQKSMDLRLFTIKETTINHSDGHISVSKTPKVTGKGQVYFINIFKKTEENAKEG
jgi:anti-repressor protein